MATDQTALLLDSNLLLLLVVGTADRGRVERFKRTSMYRASDFDMLAQIVDQMGGLVTTPHVLAEVSNLAGQLSGNVRDRVFSVLRTLIIEILEERTPAGRELVEDPVFTRLGLTDSAILGVADGITVLSDDVALSMELQNRGVSAYNFNHLRSSDLLGHLRS